jgi:acetyl esterase/lipase
MKTILLLALAITGHICAAQKVIPLYNGLIPNSKKTPKEYVEQTDSSGFIINVSVPTLTIYLPDRSIANGTAVIITPSGGYEVWVDEGVEIAKAFNKVGVAAFILKYRLPSDAIMIDKSIGPLQDAQFALVTLRQRAAEWNIDPKKVGFVGISAGGHLASTVGTHFDNAVIQNNQISLRPDFMILLYPVISFDPAQVEQTATRNNLLGEKATQQQATFFSNEKHVTHDTPPTWLTHATDDDHISVKHSLLFYEALLKSKVNAELHIISTGGHGFAPEHETRKFRWLDPCFDWMKDSGFLSAR